MSQWIIWLMQTPNTFTITTSIPPKHDLIFVSDCGKLYKNHCIWYYYFVFRRKIDSHSMLQSDIFSSMYLWLLMKVVTKSNYVDLIVAVPLMYVHWRVVAIFDPFEVCVIKNRLQSIKIWWFPYRKWLWKNTRTHLFNRKSIQICSMNIYGE